MPTRLTNLFAAAAAYAIPALAATIAAERLIRPRIFYSGRWHPDPPTPVDWPHQEARFHTPDGIELQGWLFAHPQPAPTILFMHGTSYNASDMWLTEERATAFHDFLRGVRANFFVFDYRGYGPNAGTATEEGLVTDAAAALGWLHNRLEIDPGTIFFYGFSLGTGVAAALAAREPCAGLILRAPFTSVREMAIARYPRLRAPFALAPWLPLTNFNTADTISRYNGPLLVMHGDSDNTVPERMGQEVFEAAPCPRRYVSFPNSGHSDIDPALVVPHISQFIDDVLAGTLQREQRRAR